MFAFMYNFFVYGFFTCAYVCMSGASGGSGAPRIGVRVVVNHQIMGVVPSWSSQTATSALTVESSLQSSPKVYFLPEC